MLNEFVKESENFVNGKIKLLDYCNKLISELCLSHFTLFKIEADSLQVVFNQAPDQDLLNSSKISLSSFPHFHKKIKEKKEINQRSLLLKEKEDLKKQNNFSCNTTISLQQKIPIVYSIKSNKQINKSILFIFESSLLQHFSLKDNLSQVNTQYNDLKNEFITKVSHEIRTPLNGIIGNTYLLKNQSLDSNSLSIVKNIEMAANDLLTQLNSVLTFNSIKNGKIVNEEKEIILTELIEKHCQLFIEKSQAANLYFTYEIKFKEALVFFSDETKISNVLFSLLDNAFKFTKKGFIKVEIDLVQNNLVVKIKDSGIGISQDIKKQVFSEFRQGDNSSTREHRGLGLGLSLCKQIIHSLNGDIGFHSIAGEGSEFFFQIPIIKKNEYENSQKNYSGSILLVEDDKMNQEITKKILSKMGFDVTIAENGQIAVDTCSNSNFDLIFMDCQMPIMDGYTAARLIRKMKPNQKILAFTAHAFEEDKAKCLEAGMDDFLTKPINVPQFHHCIQKHVGHIINNFQTESLEQFIDPKIGIDAESKSFITKLITDFSHSGMRDITTMENELKNNNHKVISEISHKLKSTFASFGMIKTKALLNEYQKKDNFTQEDINKLHNHFNFTIFIVHKWLDNQGVSNV